MIASSSLPRESLGAVLGRYGRDRLNLSTGAYDQLRVAVGLLDRFLGRPARLAELDEQLLIDWMRWLRTGPPPRSPATCNSKRRAILTLWRYAAENGAAPPAPTVARMREPRRLPIVWRIDQVERILAECDRQGGCWSGVPARLCWRLIVLLIWDTGCRIGEVLAARLADVDLQAGVWHVPAEHRKGSTEDRLYRLHPETVQLVRQSARWPRCRLVPWPYTYVHLCRRYGRLLRRVGLPSDAQHKFHCIRRTAESYAAAERGVEWAAAAVGHSPAVARRSYINPLVVPGPALWEALPRPTDGRVPESQLRLFD